MKNNAPREVFRIETQLIDFTFPFLEDVQAVNPVPLIPLVGPSIEAWRQMKRDVRLHVNGQWSEEVQVCRTVKVAAKVKWGCHERGKKKEREWSRIWNGEWHPTDWTIKRMWRKISNISARADNTTCSDTPGMIRWQNGIRGCFQELEETRNSLWHAQYVGTQGNHAVRRTHTHQTHNSFLSL